MGENNSQRFAAIDQGTTSTRLVITEANGAASVPFSVRHHTTYPQQGWVEQDANELLHNVQLCLTHAGDIAAIGMANQGESCLAWDAKTGEPLSPVIVWQDNRTSGTIERLRAQGLEQLTLDRAGLPLDPYFSASKLHWLVENIPAVKQAYQEKRLHIGTTDAFFLERLTGRFVTDVTTASRTSLMNLSTQTWDDTLCARFGVPLECLPTISASVANFGTLANGVPITASLVDQQASLYGHGCRNPGDIKMTFGTGAFMLMVTGDQRPNAPEGLLATTAWQMDNSLTYACEGGIYHASAAIEWAKKLGLFHHYQEIEQFAQPPAIERELVFIPALSGLAAPFWDRSASGLWIGMDGGTSASCLCQSILEGVALRAAQVINAMPHLENSHARLSIDGGLTNNPYFVQFLADVLQRDVITSSFTELTGFGCAALAAYGANGSNLVIQNDEHIYTPQISGQLAQKWLATFDRALTFSRDWKKTP
ncbi:FGGY family carbohydrate kinase [Vibrio nitrifigilis]|uniref:ATP:glycerol 3-phosphotransferase n=1 Tax=Vibrio nitrifigilis TaxID=2789781 RepID=A0ABS0GF67_9VIBR|nr:FGGY family carbohydrate kinase [Vibrio nitrifigilis]MBF9000878.1 glycerol kinase [Vibrio nitrifigilis]